MARVSDGRHGDRHPAYDREDSTARGKRNGGSRQPWEGGNDAAGMAPKLVPDYELLGRDDSGGPEYDAYNAQFGDGGYVIGEKAHLSVRGGKDDDMVSDEVSERPRAEAADRAEGEREGSANPKGPAKSAHLAKE